MNNKQLLVVLMIALLSLMGCTNMNNVVALLAIQPEPELIGDPVRGEQIFRAGVEDAPPCSTCHQTIAGGLGLSLGPNLSGISSRAAESVTGMTAEQYLVDSILYPKNHILPGYRVSMFTDYAEYFSQQNMADLVAYLLTL